MHDKDINVIVSDTALIYHSYFISFVILNLNIVSCSWILLGFSPTIWLEPYYVDHIPNVDPGQIDKKSKWTGRGSSFTFPLENHKKIKSLAL